MIFRNGETVDGLFVHDLDDLSHAYWIETIAIYSHVHGFSFGDSKMIGKVNVTM